MGDLTKEAGAVGLDLAKHAADRCRQVLLDTVCLTDHPLQQFAIGLQIAAVGLGAASGALSKATGGSKEECEQAAFEMLTQMVSGTFDVAKFTRPAKENEGHGRDER